MNSPEQRIAELEQSLTNLTRSKQNVETMLLGQIEQLNKWVDDLQSGMFINCVYCGHRYGPKDGTPVTMADVLKRHVVQCPKHPMSKCVVTLKGASHGFRSYQHGNSATDLAQEMADSIDALLAEIVA